MATCSSPESAGSCPPFLKGGCPSVCVSVRRLLLLEVGNASPGLDLGLAKCFGGVFPVVWRSSWVFLLWHSKFPPVKVALTVKIKRFLFLFRSCQVPALQNQAGALQTRGTHRPSSPRRLHPKGCCIHPLWSHFILNVPTPALQALFPKRESIPRRPSEGAPLSGSPQ